MCLDTSASSNPVVGTAYGVEICPLWEWGLWVIPCVPNVAMKGTHPR